MPASKLKEILAAVLEREGFIAGYTVYRSREARHPARDRP